MQENFHISTDKSRLQPEVIHDYLCNHSYWSKGISMELILKYIQHSMTFGVYKGEHQVGFARVITDYTTFSYLSDVFILEEYRGKGLSKKLVETIIQHPDLQGLRRWMLATKDAHGLYAQYGFTPLDAPDNFMQIKVENPYL